VKLCVNLGHPFAGMIGALSGSASLSPSDGGNPGQSQYAPELQSAGRGLLPAAVSPPNATIPALQTL
jgi:hypothetical protein